MKQVIKIIQGDSKNYRIHLCSKNPIRPEIITKIYLTCNGLKIQKECPYNSENETWDVGFESTETSKYKEGEYSFDLTIKFMDQSIKTITYVGIFEILKKINGVEL